MTGRRQLVAVMVASAVAGALTLWAAGRSWGDVALVAETGARVTADVSGSSVLPALPALGIALLVLAAGVLAARGWLRRLVGLIVVVVGGAVVGIAVGSPGEVAAALRRHAFGVAHVSVHPHLSGWAVLTTVAGVVAVIAGAAAVLFGSRWPAMGARYDAPAGAGRAEPVATAASGEGTGEQLPGDDAVWDALDRGQDPTA